jgi:hypothetical protein
VLNPTGADMNVNGRNVRGGAVEWTIKDGIPYHGPTLMREVKDIVARAGRPIETGVNGRRGTTHRRASQSSAPRDRRWRVAGACRQLSRAS